MQLFARGLATEAVEGFSTALEGVDNVHGVHSLAAGMLSVGDGVSQGVFQKHFHDRASFFGDECVDAIDTSTTSETADGGLGDALDFIATHLLVAFCPVLAHSLAPLQGSHFADFYYSSGFDKGLGSITDPPSFWIQLSQCGQCVSFRFHACFFSFVFPFFNLHPRRECG